MNQILRIMFLAITIGLPAAAWAQQGTPIPANSQVMGMIRIVEFNQSAEVREAARLHFEELRMASHTDCDAPSVLSDPQDNSIMFTGQPVAEFPEGAERPTNARWTARFEATICAAKLRETLQFEVKNGGPVIASTPAPDSGDEQVSRSYLYQFGNAGNSRRARRPQRESTTEYTYPGDDDDRD